MFNQSPWLRLYIDYNSAKERRQKTNLLLYKLFNNAVHGKYFVSERERVDIKLVNKWEGRYGAGVIFTDVESSMKIWSVNS